MDWTGSARLGVRVNPACSNTAGTRPRVHLNTHTGSGLSVGTVPPPRREPPTASSSPGQTAARWPSAPSSQTCDIQSTAGGSLPQPDHRVRAWSGGSAWGAGARVPPRRRTSADLALQPRRRPADRPHRSWTSEPARGRAGGTAGVTKQPRCTCSGRSPTTARAPPPSRRATRRSTARRLSSETTTSAGEAVK